MNANVLMFLVIKSPNGNSFIVFQIEENNATFWERSFAIFLLPFRFFVWSIITFYKVVYFMAFPTVGLEWLGGFVNVIPYERKNEQTDEENYNSIILKTFECRCCTNFSGNMRLCELLSNFSKYNKNFFHGAVLYTFSPHPGWTFKKLSC